MKLIEPAFDHLGIVLAGIGHSIMWAFRHWKSILVTLAVLVICAGVMYSLATFVDQTAALVRKTSAQNRLDRQHDIKVGNGVMVCTDHKPQGQLTWLEGLDVIKYEEAASTDLVPWCKMYLFRDLDLLTLKHIRFSANVPTGTKLWIAPLKRPRQHLAEMAFDSTGRTTNFVMFDWRSATHFINFDDIEAENEKSTK